MDKHINNHIMKNTCRAQDRELQGRVETILNGAREKRELCKNCENKCEDEHGGEIFVGNAPRLAYQNTDFRKSVWTGEHLQMTVMSIPHGGEIGAECHCDTDQYIRVEHGFAYALTGAGKDSLCKKEKLCTGDFIFIPAGVWHNVINAGRRDLKLTSIYAPPHHPKCTVEKAKE